MQRDSSGVQRMLRSTERTTRSRRTSSQLKVLFLLCRFIWKGHRGGVELAGLSQVCNIYGPAIVLSVTDSTKKQTEEFFDWVHCDTWVVWTLFKQDQQGAPQSPFTSKSPIGHWARDENTTYKGWEPPLRNWTVGILITVFNSWFNSSCGKQKKTRFRAVRGNGLNSSCQVWFLTLESPTTISWKKKWVSWEGLPLSSLRGSGSSKWDLH